MINLNTLFKNHFDSPKISDDKLKVFSEDHIQRLSVNNETGMLTTTVNDTTAIHSSYFGAIVNEATNIAIRQSNTKSVDNIIDTFIRGVRRYEGAVRSALGEDSPAYLEFFPQGLTEYSNATKTNIERLINRFIKAADNHNAQLGGDIVSFFTNINTNYVSARTAQLGKIGQVSSNKSQTKSLV